MLSLYGAWMFQQLQHNSCPLFVASAHHRSWMTTFVAITTCIIVRPQSSQQPIVPVHNTKTSIVLYQTVGHDTQHREIILTSYCTQYGVHINKKLMMETNSALSASVPPRKIALSSPGPRFGRKISPPNSAAMPGCDKRRPKGLVRIKLDTASEFFNR